MGRLGLVLFLFLGIWFSGVSPAWALPTVEVNGERLETEVEPLFQNGRVFVPARSVFEALGTSVKWDGARNRVELKRCDVSVELEAGASTVMVNGQRFPLDAPALIAHARVFVPLRFVAETFGCEVDWEAASQKATIWTFPTPATGTILPANDPPPLRKDYYVLGDPRNHSVEVTFTIRNQGTSRITDLKVYTPVYLGVRPHYEDGLPNQEVVLQTQSALPLVYESERHSLPSGDNDYASFDPRLKIRRADVRSLSGGDKIVLKDRLDVTIRDVRFNLDDEDIIPYNRQSSTVQTYTRAEPLIESDHPRIKSRADEITKELTNPLARARAVYDFVVRHLEYRINTENHGALYALDNRYVDCGEYAALFVALCRASGIPARVVAGLSQSEGKWENHGWTEFFLEGYGWIPVDPTWGDTAGENYFGRLDNTHVGLLYGFTMIKASYEYSGRPPQITLESDISRLNSPLR